MISNCAVKNYANKKDLYIKVFNKKMKFKTFMLLAFPCATRSRDFNALKIDLI